MPAYLNDTELFYLRERCERLEDIAGRLANAERPSEADARQLQECAVAGGPGRGAGERTLKASGLPSKTRRLCLALPLLAVLTASGACESSAETELRKEVLRLEGENDDMRRLLKRMTASIDELDWEVSNAQSLVDAPCDELRDAVEVLTLPSDMFAP